MLRVGGVEKSVDFRPVKRKHWRSLHMCQLLQRRQTESAPTNPHFSTPSCTASCHPCWPSAASAAAAWPDTWWRNFGLEQLCTTMILVATASQNQIYKPGCLPPQQPLVRLVTTHGPMLPFMARSAQLSCLFLISICSLMPSRS